MVPKALLDTDVLSAILRQQPNVIAKATTYLADHSRFSFSVITQYEIMRGLKAKGATKRIAAFEIFCRANEILNLDEPIALRGADVYAVLHQQGQLIGDADILIAATALVHGLVVNTNNHRHFARIPGLSLDNWLA